MADILSIPLSHLPPGKTWFDMQRHGPSDQVIGPGCHSDSTTESFEDTILSSHEPLIEEMAQEMAEDADDGQACNDSPVVEVLMEVSIDGAIKGVQGSVSERASVELESTSQGILDEQTADEATLEAHFPQGHVDVWGQQIDLRPKNTWVTKLDDVPVEELLQVHAINAMAPFILVSKLKDLLERSEEAAFSQSWP